MGRLTIILKTNDLHPRVNAAEGIYKAGNGQVHSGRDKGRNHIEKQRPAMNEHRLNLLGNVGAFLRLASDLRPPVLWTITGV